MKSSPTIDKIAGALVKAQKAIGSAKKNQENPFFKSSYADLAEVVEVIKKPLNDNGIVVLQPVSGDLLETVLLHESGEWLSGEVKIVNSKPNDPQAQGSAITYARRYGLLSMLNVPSEDDDAESAVERIQPQHTFKHTATYTEGGFVKCELCGTTNKFHKKGCPNA